MRAMFGWRQCLPALLVCACGGTGSNRSSSGTLGTNTWLGPDDAPHVQIAFPRRGESVFGPLVATVDAWDDRTGLTVEFFLNGQSIGVAAKRPYQVSWTAPATPGPFKLTATATDSGGHTVSDEIPLLKPDQYPTITFDTPKDGAVLLGQVPLFAMTTDDVGMSDVEYSIDGTLLSIVEPGQRVFWDTTTVANDSTHVVQAIAVDDKGHRTAVTSNVTIHDGAPTVSFLTPSGVTVAGGVVRLQAQASDDDSVVSVTWFVDQQPIGTISAPPYLLDWSSRLIPDGTEVSIMAQALDTRGQTTNAEMKLTIRNGAASP